MSYYEELLAKKGLTLSEEARIARNNLRVEKAPPKIKDMPDAKQPNSTLKLCTHCQYVKSVDDFHKDKNRPDGLDTRCKACKRAVAAKRWQGYSAQVRA